ncbi:MAG: transcriptional repressor [Colwellia sp.]
MSQIDKINSILEHAEKHCKNNGTRLTDKRKQILTGLIQSKKALSAYELADFCRAEYNSAIPTMSVYRILDFLENESLVHKLHLANKYIACSHISCNHEHEISQFLICSECNNVKEINIEKALIKTLQDNVNEAGYLLKSPQLELHCLCQDCAQQLDESKC